MAVEIGTATNGVDLFTKLITFLTTDSTLVGAGQAWEIAWQHASYPSRQELVMKGPGLGGDDEIFVGMYNQYEALASGEYVLWLSGAQGVLPSSLQYDAHLNSQLRKSSIFLDSSTMNYWFIANGRRFIVIVKMGTIYNSLYAGLFLPYANPFAYSYPLFIGGCRAEITTSSIAEPLATSWRNGERNSYAMFSKPYGSSSGASGIALTSGSFMLTPESTWYPVSVVTASSDRTIVSMLPFGGSFNFNGLLDTGTFGPNISPTTDSIHLGFRDLAEAVVFGPNNDYPLTPFSMTWQNDAGQCVSYGILEGCFQVPGRSNFSENIITVDAIDYLVVQSCMRLNNQNYMAIALE